MSASSDSKVPIVRLTVEHMRGEITMALTTKAAEIASGIQRAVNAAVDQFDFDREVERIAVDVIREVVRQELSGVLYDEKIRNAIRKSIAQGLRRR
jgi:hypothetical protein